MSVLIVEDDDAIREFLVDALVEAGHTVLAASNGREALELLGEAQFSPSLILLDLMMPIMNGWDLCSALSRDPALGNIPVVALSAVSRLAERTRELNIAGALPKPVALDQLLDVAARFDGPTDA